jgi:hypothetical protein
MASFNNNVLGQAGAVVAKDLTVPLKRWDEGQIVLGRQMEKMLAAKADEVWLTRCQCPPLL